MRKLATIQRVHNVRPIPGADRIEVVDVLGWSVVVNKGEFKVGDICVYFEIDSWLPNTIPAFQSEVFEKRYTNWGTKRGMRLKTIKLRKQISQGLVLPLTSFPELGNPLSYNEGDDVTEILGVEKWESPEEETSNNGFGGKQAGSKPFPSFIRKTDQERVQNYMGELKNHMDETFEVTIKLDGSSMTVFHVVRGSEAFEFAWDDMETRRLKKLKGIRKVWNQFLTRIGAIRKPPFLQGVCSRNIQLGLGEDNHFVQYVKEHHILESLENYGKSIAIQGELIAPSIQNNYEQVKNFEYHLYDVFDIEKQDYLLPKDARQVAEDLGISYVPVLGEDVKLNEFQSMVPLKKEEGVLWTQDETPVMVPDDRGTVDNILVYAEGPGMNSGVKREGVVFKSNQTYFSFKAISNSYELNKKG